MARRNSKYHVEKFISDTANLVTLELYQKASRMYNQRTRAIVISDPTQRNSKPLLLALSSKLLLVTPLHRSSSASVLFRVGAFEN